MGTRHPRPAALQRSAFTGFRFPAEVIVLAVRWYLRFGLSYRDVEELLIERGVEVDHVTVYRWVQRFTPLLAEAARPCRHLVGDRWLVDETYVKVAGRWRYVYRAIDQFGQVIDVFVSPRRDTTAARRFFEQAIGTARVTPVEVVTDRAATYPLVLEELLPAGATCTERLTRLARSSTCSVRVAGWHGGAPVLRAGDRHDEGDTGGGPDRRGTTDLPGGVRVEIVASACGKSAERSAASFRTRQWSTVPGRNKRTHTCTLFEPIPLAPTVGRDLRKRRSAQRLPAFS
jgi:transposase-like protein